MANKNNQPLASSQLLNLSELVGCEECDAIYRKVDLLVNERAYCTCCGAELYRRSRPLSSLLALVITALIIFVIANSFPIVIVELQGNTSQTTLIGAAWTMFHIERPFVGALILMTTFIVPLIELLLLSYVLSCVGLFKYRPLHLRLAMKTLFLFRTWGMVEVFLIGVLVTLVKLVGMVTVIPGIALWAFTILSILLVYIASVKIKDLWDEVDRSLA
ncbi:paraquat-inducible protein A [Acinetobacter nematophilus]|uniref:Paraquat-inducible protein A n=1 Tax=Acinetobacter nematophilus TaxID=2994642 RepID=A0A9X3DVQ2_9GAMM|nr:paraquat-inducible protein A [Acinetobacter nematophilus]MCX5468071.1 paraquat-inducible protein A [Acinetobacter nematophilus]